MIQIDKLIGGYKLKKFMKNLFEREWTKEDKIVIVFAAGVMGLVLGMLLSPPKHGFSILSHNSDINNGSDINSGSDMIHGNDNKKHE